jgi:hypothetical protein
MLDKSREHRLHATYVMDHNVMVEDCSAWSLEVQAGRMTFQMKGDPIRYNRFGKKASSYYLPKRGRTPRGRKQDEGSSSHEQHEDKPAIWIYAILVVGIAGALHYLRSEM